MKRKLRLKSKKAYSFVYKRGKRVQDQYFILCFCKSKFPKKIGFSVSKKVGKSVVRNKIRRRLKNIAQQNIEIFPENYNYIIVVRQNIKELEYKQYLDCLRKLLIKIKD